MVGFLCKDFDDTEKGSDEEIANWFAENYDISFPLMQNVITTGIGRSRLWIYLASYL